MKCYPKNTCLALTAAAKSVRFDTSKMNENFEFDYKNPEFFDRKFVWFEELKEQLESWSEQNFVPIKTRTSNRLKSEDPVSKKLVYSSIHHKSSPESLCHQLSILDSHQSFKA
ncbi:hypothetical protein BpHYR1_034184 [Brachionus plicatilis]|uniref:Uncharacterized protein n=1 Tax=Brachionus plicatilis TaxID=10195 RepID=A0A3M7QK96_BRAPC|nr:hypothetical protein BpHYR1_034184 [Brachionus plicatilis]